MRAFLALIALTGCTIQINPETFASYAKSNPSVLVEAIKQSPPDLLPGMEAAFLPQDGQISACSCEHPAPEFTPETIHALLAPGYDGPITARIGIVFDYYFIHSFNQFFARTTEETVAYYTEKIEDEIFPIFQRDFDLYLEVAHVRYFETLDDDPYMGPSSTWQSAYWDWQELASDMIQWNGANLKVPYDLDCVIVLTGRSFGVAGAAGGQVCVSRPTGYSRGYNVQVIAHEIAHQFGVGHDINGEYAPIRYIMNSGVSSNFTPEFSPRSKDHFQFWLLQRGECVDPYLIQEDPNTREFIRGDVNNDGSVKLFDCLPLAKYLFGGGDKPSCEDACDANDDGKLTLQDVLYIANYSQGRGPQPPAPFQDSVGVLSPGPDPTADALSCQ